jgi:hypothetical protein
MITSERVNEEVSKQTLTDNDDDDIFGEREPVGFTTYNPARDHAAAFLKEVQILRRCGYAIEAQVM